MSIYNKIEKQLVYIQWDITQQLKDQTTVTYSNSNYFYKFNVE